MSQSIPTSYGQAQYNFSGYNYSVIPVGGSVALIDGFSLNDNITGRSGQDLDDLLKITEWLNVSIQKPSIWNSTLGSSSVWTKPTSSTGSTWINVDPK